MKILVAYVLFGETLTGDEGVKAIKTLWTENTGVTLIEYDEEKKGSPWRLKVWNDHAHLG